MFESGLSVSDLGSLVVALGGLDRSVSDAVRVDRIGVLESVKAACAAAQARDAADLDASQRVVQAAAGVPAAQLGRGVGSQVALARRDSPFRGDRHLGLAKALVHEMPHTLAALSSGVLSEWRATLVVKETAVLSVADRAAVDVELAGTSEAVARLGRLGDRALGAAARQAAYRVDAASVVERARRAERERRVTLRPAPDTMAYLTALVPVRDGVAVMAALGRAAECARNAGDCRGRGQVMADALVVAVTEGTFGAGAAAGVSAGPGSFADGGGITWAGADMDNRSPGTGPSVLRVPARPGPFDVSVQLVMTDRALLDGDSEPALLGGYGPVPAAWARDLIAQTLEPPGEPVASGGPGEAAAEDGARKARVFVRRVLSDPVGSPVAVDSRARTAPAGLARLVRLRDGGTCRTPGCDAPIRHVDHVRAHAEGGRTSLEDLQGLCEACNYTKQAPGWTSKTISAGFSRGAVGSSSSSTGSGSGGSTGRTSTSTGSSDQDTGPPGTTGPTPDTRHTVVITTPTGHTYTSVAPPLPGTVTPTTPLAVIAGGEDAGPPDEAPVSSSRGPATETTPPIDGCSVEAVSPDVGTTSRDVRPTSPGVDTPARDVPSTSPVEELLLAYLAAA